jgi:NADH-quinone oxidoreductase subunit L
MVFLTFHGEARTEQAEDPESVRWNVKLPLVVLGILAATTGFLNMAPVKKLTGLNVDYLHQWLHGPKAETAPLMETLSTTHYHHLLHDVNAAEITAATLGPLAPGAVSLGFALVGSLLAYRLYAVPEPDEHTAKLGRAKDVLYNNYYQDEYQVWLATNVVAPLASVADTFDQSVVDGVVNGVSSVSLLSGSRIRRIQTGVVSNYAALVTLGLTVLLVAFGLYGGWLL